MSLENQFEKTPERILTKEEVLKELLAYAKKGEVVQEKSDENGVYVLNIKIEAENPGEHIQYEYIRKGRFPKDQSSDTHIEKVYYQHGVPCAGYVVATFNPDTGEWR